MTPKNKIITELGLDKKDVYTFLEGTTNGDGDDIIDIALKEQAKEIYSKLLKTTMEEYNYSILDLQKELLEKYT